MADILEINQMLANEFEPKRQFRWVIEIDGLDAFTAKSFARPSLVTESITIDYINQKRYLAGKDEWQTLELVMYDPIAPTAAQKVTQWMRLVHEHLTGRAGYAVMYKRNFSLKMLDGLGAVVEKWNIIGAWPLSVNFGELDYANNEAAMITTTIRMDNCVLEF